MTVLDMLEVGDTFSLDGLYYEYREVFYNEEDEPTHIEVFECRPKKNLLTKADLYVHGVAKLSIEELNSAIEEYGHLYFYRMHESIERSGLDGITRTAYRYGYVTEEDRFEGGYIGLNVPLYGEPPQVEYNAFLWGSVTLFDSILTDNATLIYDANYTIELYDSILKGSSLAHFTDTNLDRVTLQLSDFAIVSGLIDQTNYTATGVKRL